MGKGNRIKNNKNVTAPLSSETFASSHKKLITVVMSALLVIAIAISSVLYVSSTGILYRNDVAAKSRSFTVTTAMVSFFFNTFLNNELQTNQDMYTYSYGLDLEKPLDEQYYNETQKITWFDFFLDSSKNQIMETIIFAEGAVDSNVALTENDYKRIEDELASYKTAADEEGISYKKYLKREFGKCVRESDIVKSLELLYLADKQYDYLENNFSPTDKEINDYYKENIKYFQKTSYLTYTFNGSTALERAEEMLDVKSQDEFYSRLKSFLKNSAGYSNSKIEKELKNCLQENQSFIPNDNSSDWLFSNDRKSGDTKVFSDAYTATIYFVISPPKSQDIKSVNVRHILLSVIKYSNKIATEVKAQELIDEWKANGSTVEYFEELCKKYSEDENTRDSGGLYKNYREGDNENAFEFDDWCFAEGRKAGDCEVKTADYGAHVMYLESFGEDKWRLDVKDYLLTETLDDAHVEYYEKYPVDYFPAAFNNLK